MRQLLPSSPCLPATKIFAFPPVGALHEVFIGTYADPHPHILPYITTTPRHGCSFKFRCPHTLIEAHLPTGKQSHVIRCVLTLIQLLRSALASIHCYRHEHTAHRRRHTSSGSLGCLAAFLHFRPTRIPHLLLTSGHVLPSSIPSSALVFRRLRAPARTISGTSIRYPDHLKRLLASTYLSLRPGLGSRNLHFFRHHERLLLLLAPYSPDICNHSSSVLRSSYNIQFLP